MRAAGVSATAVLLTAMAAFGPISTDLYLPSLPGIARHFATDAPAAQATLSAFLVGIAAGQVLYGPLSDRFGRRPAVLAGLALYLAASIACALAPSIEWLTTARFLQALGGASGPVLARAIVRDLYAPERAASVLAYMGSAMAVAPLIGPVIGGQVEIHWGWRANFALLALFGATILMGVALILGETNRRRDPHALAPARVFGNIGAMLGNPRYRGAVLASTFCYAGLFAFISASSFVLTGVLGLTPDLFGLCFAAVVVGYMIGALSAGRVVFRLGIDRVLLVGAVFCAVGGSVLGVLALASGAAIALWAIVLPMMLYAAGAGLVLPAGVAAAIAPYPEKAGAASSLLGFVQMSTAAAFGALVSRLLDGTARPMALAIAAGGVLTLVAILAMRRAGGARAAA